MKNAEEPNPKDISEKYGVLYLIIGIVVGYFVGWGLCGSDGDLFLTIALIVGIVGGIRFIMILDRIFGKSNDSCNISIFDCFLPYTISLFASPFTLFLNSFDDSFSPPILCVISGLLMSHVLINYRHGYLKKKKLLILPLLAFVYGILPILDIFPTCIEDIILILIAFYYCSKDIEMTKKTLAEGEREKSLCEDNKCNDDTDGGAGTNQGDKQ